MAHYVVPGNGSPYSDIRWASPDSVFLSRAWDGVVELEVSDKATRRRQPVPPGHVLRPSAGRPLNFLRLAVSPQYMAVAASAMNLTWRRISSTPGGEVIFEHKAVGAALDIDLRGDRLIMLGTPHAQVPFAPKGEIAWTGTLSASLNDLVPVLYDISGPPAPHLMTCLSLGLGAVRFLEDGSFVVVPGFQPGAHLFNAAGKLVRSWSGEETGLTTDCSGMTEEEGYRVEATFETFLNWLNRRRALDDVIPLPEGPGLLVRYQGADGKLHWELRVLRQGGVETWPVPIVSSSLNTRLHGDVWGGKIALLLSSTRFNNKDQADLDGELFIAELRRR